MFRRAGGVLSQHCTPSQQLMIRLDASGRGLRVFFLCDLGSVPGAWNHCSGLCGAWQEGALGKDILLIPFHLTCSQVGIANRKFATQPGTPNTIHHSVQAGDT
ncbi:unnamed protein product [Arctogadus glacialis]